MVLPVLLTSEEVGRCKSAISKLPKGDIRACYLAWRLTGGVIGTGAPKIPPAGQQMWRTQDFKTCNAHLKNRDVLKWLSLPLPKPSGNWNAATSLNALATSVSKGVESLDSLTVWVMRAQSVMQMKELCSFEQAPRFQVYVTNLIDRDIHFISHKWYGNQPDSENQAVLRYVQNLVKIGTKNGFKGIDEDDLIWIDYCCVPQQNQEKKMQELVKIPYLLNYSQVHIFAEHADYDKSIWCRVEQTVNAAIGPCKDLSDFWIQDPRDLAVMLPSLIQLDVAKMKIKAFMCLEDLKNSVIAIHPNYWRVDYLVPNNILLEMILYSLEC